MFRAFLILILISFGCFVWAHSCRLAEETANVAQEQLGPRALLKKYEWFKDAAAQLDAKKADIQVAQNRIDNMIQSYGKTPRARWSRADQEQQNLWFSEVSGITMGYNGLAAEYNSAMSKVNYRFTNAGDLPAGATEVLPREFRKYQTQAPTTTERN